MNKISWEGASKVKWTTPEPYIGLSESDLKLYTNFDFFEENYCKQFKNTMIHKAKKYMLTESSKNKSLHILEHSASGVQVGDIEQVIV